MSMNQAIAYTQCKRRIAICKAVDDARDNMIEMVAYQQLLYIENNTAQAPILSKKAGKTIPYRNRLYL